MLRKIPDKVADQADAEITAATSQFAFVNVSALAERLRRSCLESNIALEDLERYVLAKAVVRGAVIVFDKQAVTSNIHRVFNHTTAMHP